jgi:hypothetical protein
VNSLRKYAGTGGTGQNKATQGCWWEQFLGTLQWKRSEGGASRQCWAENGAEHGLVFTLAAVKGDSDEITREVSWPQDFGWPRGIKI